MNSKPRILYVDDEESNLKAFKTSFRREYEVLLASSGKEGLALLEKENVELVISDQRMPQMTGVAFLTEVHKKYPHLKLILLTGYADLEAIIQALNECKIYNYINKPWVESDLRLKISNALEAYYLQTQNQELLKNLQKLNQELENKVEERTQKIKEQNIKLWKKNQLIESSNYELLQAQKYIKNINEQLLVANNSLEDKVKERTRKLQELNLELQKANEELDKFIYRTSHDLRGPIATIQGLVHLVQISPENLDYCKESILATTKKMDRTLEKLKYINAINHSSLQNTPIQIFQLVQNSYYHFFDKLTQNELDFSYEIPPNLYLRLDGELMKIILDNLVENAIYFKANHSAFIKIFTQEDQKNLYLCIQDNGIGIAEQEIPKIFQMFTRASEASKGNGLGLYIVNKALEKLKIDIAVTTQLQTGTTFRLIIPQDLVERI